MLNIFISYINASVSQVNVIVNLFSKSLWGSGLGVILRSLRNSPFVLQEPYAYRIYRLPSGSYALFKLYCMQCTRYRTHPGAPLSPDNPKPASQAFSRTFLVSLKLLRSTREIEFAPTLLILISAGAASAA